ncbi:MAG: hypothetical protein QW814_03905, partial [Methanothrix sp.]
MEIKKEAAITGKDEYKEIASLSRSELPKSAKRDFLSWMESERYVVRDVDGRLKANTRWNNKDDRVKSVRKLVETLQISPLDLKNDDFFKMGLIDLLKVYSIRRSSFPAVFNALREAFPELDINLWDLRGMNGSVSKNKETADEAVKWLAKKKSGAIAEKDFEENGIGFVFSFYN